MEVTGYRPAPLTMTTGVTRCVVIENNKVVTPGQTEREANRWHFD